MAGDVLVGWLVRLACARHLRDLEEGPARGLTWDVAAAEHALGFFENVLCLNGGDWEGEPFVPRPWQLFIVGSLFGWKLEDGSRRFRLAYVEIGKGNGKSPLAAGIGMYMLAADREARAEIYSAAAKRDQAMILFRDAVAMYRQSPALRRRLRVSGGPGREWNLAYLDTHSFFRPIASDDAQSGPRPHCGLIDELHEHKDDTVVNMLRAGTKGRRQALIFEITNSGFDRTSVCYQHRMFSIQVLDGTLANDSWFAFVCGLDPCPACRAGGRTQPNDDCPDCDDWRDEAVWAKANPNLDVSITRRYLRELVAEAQGMPAKQGIVKRLNFCVWTELVEHAIAMEVWAAGDAPIDPLALRHRPCFGGMDLAKVNDLSAFVLVFPPLTPEEPWQVLPWFWVPTEDVARRSRGSVTYDLWARAGHLDVTPGNTTDYGFIRQRILELAALYRIREIAFDPVFGGELVQNLMGDGLTLVEFRQGFLSMAAPTAELLRLLKAGKLQHGGHPVLRWNASNLSLRQDPAGNLKPDKERSADKIDGIVATIMALGRATVGAAPKASVYERRGPLVLEI